MPMTNRIALKTRPPVKTPRRKRSPVRGSASVLTLVRNGVERFILEDANMTSFMKAVRTAGKEGKSSSHPLTGAAFRRIVKQAIRKRKMRMGRAAQQTIHRRRKNPA